MTEQRELKKPKLFHAGFQGYMDFYCDPETVADYFNAHKGWFQRCAKPMHTVSLGDDKYLIVIGKFGALGYQVEPKMAVILHPPQNSLYLMHSIPVPDSKPQGYEIDYRATMKLEQMNLLEIPSTRVTWHLDLKIAVEFPDFVDLLPGQLVQSSGDKLLNKIVKEVSQRLTYKVQQDFHASYCLPMPPKSSRGVISQRVDIEIPL